ncbi:MAG: shikimate kinase [Clostridia bacterium]|nr:shikimate kinase [Clostridia bacterium]
MIHMHIFLVGMAGAGKTSLGRRLAQNLNWRFVDTDQRVCEMLGMTSVNEIFQTLGEPFFRNAETGALIELVGQPPCVVSTGGELCTFNENVTIMKNHGVIIHIDRPLDQIISDIKTDRRPLLAGGTHEDVIDQYNRCIGHYRAAADYRLDNSKGFVLGVKNLTDLVESIE